MQRSILVSTLLALALSARASVPDSLAVRAILGEGANQSYETKLAIACCIRNRGSLQGVYGVSNYRAQSWSVPRPKRRSEGLAGISAPRCNSWLQILRMPN